MAQTCPNDDPKFTQLLTTLMGTKPDALTRQQLFYFVCIIVRGFLYWNVYKYRDHEWTPYIVALLAIFSIYNLKDNLESGTQWWSRKFQFAIACLLLLATVLTVYKQIPTTIMPYLLFASLAGGILQSLFVKFC